jgi:biotin carboxyl carrier protein
MSSRKHLFRQEAFARRGQTEPLDGLLRVTAPHEWVLLAGLAAALLGIVLWGSLGRIERSLSAHCVLALSGERHPVVSGVSGTIQEVLASPGDGIAAGQPVARVGLFELNNDAAVARARVAVLESIAETAPNTLAAARAELSQIELLQAEGELLVSPVAGELMSYSVAVGQSVVAGGRIALVRVDTRHELEAITLLDAENARHLEKGMQARVTPAFADRKAARPLNATVADITARRTAPPQWLTDLGLPAPAQSHRVRLALQDSPPHLTDGTPCGLHVVLSREPPVRVLFRSVPWDRG